MSSYGGDEDAWRRKTKAASKTRPFCPSINCERLGSSPVSTFGAAILTSRAIGTSDGDAYEAE